MTLKAPYILLPVWLKASVAAFTLAIAFSVGIYIGGNHVSNDVVINNFPSPQVSNEEMVIPAFALGTMPGVVIIYRCVKDPGEGRRTKRQRGTGC